LAYFTNPSYPSTDSQPNYCTYTIKVRHNDCTKKVLDGLSVQPALTFIARA
jgi:hypothetical protein